MDAQLLDLRSTVYGAAINFHRLAAEYFTALRLGGTADEKEPVTVSIEESATLYMNALDDLLGYLRTLETTPEIEQEIHRIRRMQKLLQQEVRLMLRPASQ